ncbi:uncharacterized protein BXIN_2822 [Babesia sp. Xinjiang]|uniref:uncharacterized protein n=1 Tax=Babesia sp. Xinjiang TaxID=462227 RepID=UPI000A24F54C|nr:uncharacterized protein BXIN_2822 [Babesia sp. Xinjiang]ORM41753.1 hypothetical protein BXIN_2822 [Babesia sp. Xinjiang]
MRNEKCSPGRLVEAFLVGCSILVGIQQFELVLVKVPGEVVMLYHYYIGMVVFTLWLAQATNTFNRHVISFCIIGQVLSILALFAASSMSRSMRLLRIVIVMISANLNTVLMIQVSAAYSGNPVSLVALLCGTYLSLKLPYLCRAWEHFSSAGALGFMGRQSATHVLLAVKCVAVVTAIAARYISGEPCYIRTSIWNTYKNYVNVWKAAEQGNPLKTMIYDLRKDEDMWICFGNLAALVAMVVAMPPHLALRQLPIASHYLDDLNGYERWSEGLGVFTGATMPLAYSNRDMLPLLIFTAFLLNIACVMLSAYFTTISFLSLSWVTKACVLSSFVTGYAMSFSAGKMVFLFFLRTCKGPDVAKRCCDELLDTGCLCSHDVTYYDCERRVKPFKCGDKEVKEEPTTHILWAAKQCLPTATQCFTLKCKCNKTPNTCKNCCKKDTPEKCCTTELLKPKQVKQNKSKCEEEEEKEAAKVCNATTPQPSSAPAPAAQTSTPSQPSSSDATCDTQSEEWCPKCFCKNTMGRDCGSPCCGCFCTTKEKTETTNCCSCVQWIATRQAQHYLLRDTSTSTCGDCDLTILLKGVPLGRRGELCCVSTFECMPRVLGWQQWNPKSDRVFIGYIDSDCAVCSLVEIRPKNFAKEYNLTISNSFPHHFNIESMSFGGCCHDTFLMKVQCAKRDKYPHIYNRDYAFKQYLISHLYFTSASVMDEECEKTGTCGKSQEPSESQECKDTSKKSIDWDVFDNYTKCCFSVATRVFTYYRYVTENKGKDVCVSVVTNKSNEARGHATCKGKCETGCCVKVHVTDEHEARLEDNAYRYRVSTRFWMIVLFFQLMCMMIQMLYKRPGVNAPYKFAVDIVKLQQSVLSEGWDDDIRLLVNNTDLAQLNSEVYGLAKMLSLLTPFIDKGSRSFEGWVKDTVKNGFPEYVDVTKEAQFDLACLELARKALRVCLRDKMPGFELYLFQWEKKWKKEFRYYNGLLINLMHKSAHKSRVAQAAIYDSQRTNDEIDMYQEVRVRNWNELIEELGLSKEICEHEEHVKRMMSESDGNVTMTVQERLDRIWAPRLKHIALWKEKRLCIFDWSGFLESYRIIRGLYKYHE